MSCFDDAPECGRLLMLNIEYHCVGPHPDAHGQEGQRAGSEVARGDMMGSNKGSSVHVTICH